MPFIDSARELVPTLQEDDPMRITLEYLLERAVGADNAVLIETVLIHLRSRGIEISRESFQHEVLGASRKGAVFIGVRIKKGIYLIESEEDARTTWNFYHSRIASEQTHLQYLEDLIRQEGWNI